MNRLPYTLVISLTLCLAGCLHHPNKAINCQKIDWEQFGHDNGISGKKITYLSEAFPTCRQTIIVDKSAYHRGWQSGLLIYCTPKQGYLRGIDGHGYSGFCPQPLHPGFQVAYQKGAADFQPLLTVKLPYYDANAALKKLHQSKQVLQQRLETMTAAYKKRPFSPETQYKIQTIKLRIARFSKQEEALQKKIPFLRNQYEKMRLHFIKHAGFSARTSNMR